MLNWLEYTNEKIESEQEVLYRTRYFVDFSDKKKGDLSGYISKDVELPEEPILIDEKSYIYSGCEIGENAKIIESTIKKSIIRPCTIIRKSAITNVSFLFSGNEDTQEKNILILDSNIECVDEQPLVVFLGANTDFSSINSKTIKNSKLFGADKNARGIISLNDGSSLEIVSSNIEIGKEPINVREKGECYFDNTDITNKTGKGKAHVSLIENGFAYFKGCYIQGEIFCKQIKAFDCNLFGTIVLNNNQAALMKKCFVEENSKIYAADKSTLQFEVVDLRGNSSIELLYKRGTSTSIASASIFNTTISKRSIVTLTEAMSKYPFSITNSTISGSTIKDSYIAGCKICPIERCYINRAVLTNVGIEEGVKIGYDIYDKMCKTLYWFEISDIDITRDYINIFPITEEKSIVTIGSDCFLVEGKNYEELDMEKEIVEAIDFMEKTRRDSPLITDGHSIISMIKNSEQEFIRIIEKTVSDEEVAAINAAYDYSILSVMNFSDKNKNETINVEKIQKFENFLEKHIIVDIFSKTKQGFSKNAVFIPQWLITRFGKIEEKNTFIL